LHFSADTRLGSIFLRKAFARAKSNSMDLFPKIIGQKILRITQIENQRVLRFEFLEFNLFFVLFGGSRNNAFLTNQNNVIVDSFKSSKKYVGKDFQIVKETSPIFADRNIFDFLSKEKFLGKYYAKLLLSEIGFSPNLRLSQLTEVERQQLETAVNKFTPKLQSAECFELYFVNNEYFLSLIPLNEGRLIKKYNSISESAFDFYVKSIKLQSLKERYEKARKIIESKLKYLRGMQESLRQSKSVAETQMLYKLYGDILVSQPNARQKGLSKLKTFDFDSNPIEIPLKPELTLLENSQMYYDKAKKLHDRSPTFSLKEKEILDSIAKYENLHNELLSIPDILKFGEFEMKHKDFFAEISPTDENQPSGKFRHFDLGDGYVLYVGKNARNNDELTFGFAKPNDYWFHARSVGGSHCVLRVNRGQIPPKHIIQKAGQIAGYFSKARKSKYIPVAYTQRKYIHKPKGMPPGTVVMAREEVIMVEPKAPDGPETTSIS
jgi:predicted ribosome quality control (RQC) complex YloA/Tae2 family protein